MVSDEVLIKSIYKKLLENKGLVILEEMSYERARQIFKIVKRYPMMDSLVINNKNSNKQIVLRYFSHNSNLDLKSLNEEGLKAYNNGDFEECIRLCSLLVQSIYSPKEFLFRRLGYAYAYTGRVEEAINYLTVASGLSKDAKKDEDIIRRLKNGGCISSPKKSKSETKKESDEDSKPFFIVQSDEFENDGSLDMYGIDFENVNAYIESSGLSVEEACLSEGMSREQIDTIKLIYAREYYIKGDMARGDLFLRSVEKNKEKSSCVKEILSDIKANRKFYQFRENIVGKQLRLIRPNN